MDWEKEEVKKLMEDYKNSRKMTLDNLRDHLYDLTGSDLSFAAAQFGLSNDFHGDEFDPISSLFRDVWTTEFTLCLFPLFFLGEL